MANSDQQWTDAAATAKFALWKSLIVWKITKIFFVFQLSFSLAA